MTNPFTPGQTVVINFDFDSALSNRRFRSGDLVTIDEVDGQYVTLVEDVAVDGDHRDLWAIEWFSATDKVANVVTISAGTGVIVVEPSQAYIVRRSYDYKQGDARRQDREEAINFARRRVAERGCRQQVRQYSPALHGGEPTWLIQDI